MLHPKNIISQKKQTQITQMHTDIHPIICANLCASVFELSVFRTQKHTIVNDFRDSSYVQKIPTFAA